MRYYVWDKKSNVAGVSASFLLKAKPEFLDDDVIGILDEFDVLLHFETMRSLQNKYKIWSNIPSVVGARIVEKLENDYPLQPNGLLDGVDEATSIYLESVMYDVRFSHTLDDIFPSCNCSYDEYQEPECKITSVVEEGYDGDKSITLVVENLSFICSSIEKVDRMKIMRRVNERINILKDKIQDAINNADNEKVRELTVELEELYDSLLEPTITLNISVNIVYEYNEFILAKTTDGQTMIIDREVVSSCKHNAISYEKCKDDGTKLPVYYETIYVKLSDNVESELREFDETVYITY